VATDAPLLPHQLKRLAKRPALAIGRLGGVGAASSGDIFLAISTSNADVSERPGESSAPCDIKMHPNVALTPLFEATIDATEEAILNALIVGEAAEGANRLYVPRLPHSRVQEVLRAHQLLRTGC
jgi:L-aminopeptidase/D-esterase-like protein